MSVQIAPISSSLSAFLQQNSYSRVVVVVDEKTNKFCFPKIHDILPSNAVKIQIKSGENNKNLQTCTKIWEAMTNAKLDRHALMINLGGGVIGDMGGFCASTYKRGIDFIQIPTTLLSQVDASVGGKLGIDFNGFKNHIGVFQLPKTVLVDPSFTNTLPEAEKRSGFAEIIKHCLIRDAKMWDVIRKMDWFENNFAELIQHSIEIKQKIVEEDPKEKGLRKILNFGHTLGHAIETFLLDKGKRKILHGEAVAVGMITEAFLAEKRGLISPQELEDIEIYLFETYGKVHISTNEIEEIVTLTLQDKKNKGKEVLFSLLTGIGDCGYDIPVSKKEMLEALAFYIG